MVIVIIHTLMINTATAIGIDKSKSILELCFSVTNYTSSYKFYLFGKSIYTKLYGLPSNAFYTSFTGVLEDYYVRDSGEYPTIIFILKAKD